MDRVNQSFDVNFTWHLPKLFRIELPSEPLGYYYKYITQCELCMPIPQLLKFWKIKFETAEPCFLKLKQYVTKKCQLLVVGTALVYELLCAATKRIGKNCDLISKF